MLKWSIVILFLTFFVVDFSLVLYALVLTWYNEISNLCVAFGKWIKNPPTSNKKPCVRQVILVRVGIKTMNPKTQFVKLSSIEPRVHLQPIWSDEARGDEDNHGDTDRQSHIACQRSLSARVRVRQKIISNTHLEGFCHRRNFFLQLKSSSTIKQL